MFQKMKIEVRWECASLMKIVQSFLLLLREVNFHLFRAFVFSGKRLKFNTSSLFRPRSQEFLSIKNEEIKSR